MGVPPAIAQASIIMSFGKDNTEEEMAFAAEAYCRVITRLRALSPTWSEFQQGLIDSVIQPRQQNPLPASALGA
jgi:hypothetical protein